MNQTRHNIASAAFAFALLLVTAACSGQISAASIPPIATNTTIPTAPPVIAAPTIVPPSVIPATLTPAPTATSGNSLPSAAPTATVAGTSPRTVTLADDGQTLNLELGDRFVLDLGGGFNWKVTIDNPAIVAQASGAVHPGAPVYQANQPGTTTLHATGDPPCLNSTPRCLAPSRLFQVRIVVTSTVPAAQTITLDDEGKSITVHMGQSFLVNLGEGFNWTVTVDDPTIISRVKNITVVRGAQGVYQAQQPGTTTLHATGIIVCPPLQACPQIARAFQVQVVVIK